MVTSTKAQYKGFGFNPEDAGHHFLVSLTSETNKNPGVRISEHFEWNPNELNAGFKMDLGKDEKLLRVMLRLEQWQAIADPAKAEFNRRLKEQGVPTGQWKKAGHIPLARQLGKELVLLAWAIEDAELRLIPNAIYNWLGLTPEERWWLFTMTNAATGQAEEGKNIGWRKAVRFALTENPASAKTTFDRETFAVNLPLYPIPKKRKKQEDPQQSTLFSMEEGDENNG
jgi:hypothetical protein